VRKEARFACLAAGRSPPSTCRCRSALACRRSLLGGLPDKAVAESRERVRSVLGPMGLGLPPKRITINLALDYLTKEGSHFPSRSRSWSAWARSRPMRPRHLALGELVLDGAILRVACVLPAAVAASARELGLICPAACGGEAIWLGSEIKSLEWRAGVLSPRYRASPSTRRTIRSSSTSRARRPPNARSKSPRPAATTSYSLILPDRDSHPRFRCGHGTRSHVEPRFSDCA
jgi:hypothetical protein